MSNDVNTQDGGGQKPKTDDTTGTNGSNSGEVSFTPEQQAKIDKIVGERLERERKKIEAEQAEAKQKADDEAEQARLAEERKFQELADKHKAKVGELEPQVASQAETISSYETAVSEILEAEIKAIGDAAKTAVDNLPGDPGPLEKLQWLKANQELFKTDKTPAPPPRKTRMGQRYQNQQQPAAPKPGDEGYRPAVTL